MDVNDLKLIAALYKHNVKELEKVYDTKTNNIDEIIDEICSVLKECEKQIEDEHKKVYVTDEYENEVRSFTNTLVYSIIENGIYKELKDNSSYNKLLCQRHVAYSFYHCINSEEADDITLDEKNNIRNLKEKFDQYIDENCNRNLYNGLANFYSKFYGRFYDNQEAIELLCKYYPQNISDFSKEEKNVIREALYKHVSSAGTPNDLGYAYGGIELIRKYIGNLPEEIVKDILELYPIDRLTLMSVFRHQVVSIIMYSSMSKEEKERIKFWCIDAIMIIEYLNKKIIQIIKEENSVQIEYAFSGMEKTIINNIDVLKTPKTYWQNTAWEKWTLYVNNEINAELSIDNIEFYGQAYDVNFDSDDWQVNIDYNKIFLNDRNLNNKKDQILFSLLYLNEYRGLKNRLISFDHKYDYNKIDKKITKKISNSSVHFYGKKVYSLTCLVGKNGTGKTSIIDFLRETFFGMLYIIKKNGGLERGCIDKKNYEKYGILDEGAEFVVVFHINDNSYYITNMSGVSANDVNPLTNEFVININSIGKVGYFSNMLRADQMQLYDYDWYKENNEREKLLKEINLKDFSETKSFIIKHNQINEIKNQKEKKANELKDQKEENATENIDLINRDLFYQLFFLYNLEEDRLKSMFDYTESKHFYIENFEDNNLDLSQLRKKDVFEKIIDDYKNNPLAVLKHFSSGEYFKFMLFSKIYYFLNGKENGIDIPFFEKYWYYLQEDCVSHDEATLIFIDEGEVYYHPEWQRRYISDLLDIINIEGEGKVQIILTTNSPFIISDVLGEDVIYLSNKNNDNSHIGVDGVTLGQNIHKLLTDNFFMEATIGEYAKKFIKCISKYISNPNENDDLENYINTEALDYDKIENMIELIGEPVYKINLKMMLSQSQLSKEETLSSIQNKISRLDKEKEKLQEKLKKISQEGSNDKK